MLEWSLAAMGASGVVDAVVLVVPEGQVRHAESLRQDPPRGALVDSIVPGGESRLASVRAGLSAVSDRAEVILCHDAARPFASATLFHRVVKGLRGSDGAVPVVSITDTIKRVASGAVLETLAREDLRAAQTPQAFRAEALRSVHSRPVPNEAIVTDDSALLEAAGYRVVVVEGEDLNFKVTDPEDLSRAETLLERMDAPPIPGRPS